MTNRKNRCPMSKWKMKWLPIEHYSKNTCTSSNKVR